VNSVVRNTLRIGRLSIDINAREVAYDGTLIALSTQEFDVLQLLASTPGEAVDRQTLTTRLRGIDYDGTDRSVDLAISRLRRKLDDPAEAPRRIKTLRGRGYLLSPDAW